MNSDFFSKVVQTDLSDSEIESSAYNSNSLPSMFVLADLSEAQLQQLSVYFTTSVYSEPSTQANFESALIDCRGSEIRCPKELYDINASVTFALIDEESHVKEPRSDAPLASNIENLVLITEAEIHSNILQLRFRACITDWALKPANQKDKQIYEKQTPNTDLLHEDSFELVRNILKNTSDWVVVKDLDNRFIAVSHLFLTTQNLTLEEVIGKNDLEIGADRELVLGSPEHNWKGYWKLDKEVIDSGKPSIYQYIVIEENSLEQVREHVTKIPLRTRSGKIYGLLVFVSQQHHLSKNDKNALSDETTRRNLRHSPMLLTLSDERMKAEAKTRRTKSDFLRKNNFIATASHDLRQPLHAIGLFVESLENQTSDKEQLAIITKIKQSSKDLNSLLNSVLDITKLNADAVVVRRTNFSIGKVLKLLQDEFETEAALKSLTLNIDYSDTIAFTDNILLNRMVKILVGNAIKHTHTGNVDIYAKALETSIELYVRDTGPGIPSEQYQAIFSDYHRAQDYTNAPNFGMGFGLYIVHRLAKLLEIDLNLEHTKDGGSCFRLTIPLGDAANNSNGNGSKLQTKDDTQLTLEHYKILVVEDDPIVLDAMQSMLSSINCDAYPASNVKEAIEIINELTELPDLLLVDYQLADGLTGDVAIQEIHKTSGQYLPAIIVTGNTNSDIFKKASESNCSVLVKPINPDVLLNNIVSSIKEFKLDS